MQPSKTFYRNFQEINSVLLFSRLQAIDVRVQSYPLSQRMDNHELRRYTDAKRRAPASGAFISERNLTYPNPFRDELATAGFQFS
jgi:hypothetical protein